MNSGHVLRRPFVTWDGAGRDRPRLTSTMVGVRPAVHDRTCGRQSRLVLARVESKQI